MGTELLCLHLLALRSLVGSPLGCGHVTQVDHGHFLSRVCSQDGQRDTQVVSVVTREKVTSRLPFLLATRAVSADPH